jgi:glycosyltransferase involved in cell wall biosynthesis
MTSVRAAVMREHRGPTRLVASAIARRARLFHAHGAAAAPVVAAAARSARRPFVVSLYGEEDVRQVDGLHAAELVVVADETLVSGAVRCGAKEHRIRVIPPGIRLARLARSSEERRRAAIDQELGARAADLEQQYHSILDGAGPCPVPAHPTDWPFVSVVIPTFDRRVLVLLALDAIAHQTYPPERMEVILVDNGSVDGTSDLVQGRSWPWRLRLERFESNRSPAEARNAGIALADGDVVAFTDSDCRPTPTWLEALVAGFVQGVGLVQGYTLPDPAQPLEPLSRSQAVVSEYGLYETCNIAYTREVLATAGPGPFSSGPMEDIRRLLGRSLAVQAFGEDADLAWRVKRAGASSRFASHAVVHHHVFPPSRRELLRRSTLVAGFPVLVSAHPELRRAFLWGRFFLSPRRAMILAAVTGSVAALRWRPAMALVAPYAGALLSADTGVRRRRKIVPARISQDVVETVALVYGSARARCLVL